MTSYSQQFIEKYINLIDEENWDEFYQLVNTNVKLCATQTQGEVTRVLWNAGIQPHFHMHKVPEAYLQADKWVTKIIIPGNCRIIEPYAFAMSSVNEVILHEGLDQISNSAFMNCPNLKTMELPRSIRYISNNAFINTKIKFKVYENSYAQQWCDHNMYSWELINI